VSVASTDTLENGLPIHPLEDRILGPTIPDTSGLETLEEGRPILPNSERPRASFENEARIVEAGEPIQRLSSVSSSASTVVMANQGDGSADAPASVASTRDEHLGYENVLPFARSALRQRAAFVLRGSDAARFHEELANWSSPPTSPQDQSSRGIPSPNPTSPSDNDEDSLSGLPRVRSMRPGVERTSNFRTANVGFAALSIVDGEGVESVVANAIVPAADEAGRAGGRAPRSPRGSDAGEDAGSQKPF
jgi:hypothetical protein